MVPPATFGPALAALLLAAAPGQSPPWFILGHRGQPLPVVHSLAATTGDVDGDGDLDIVVGAGPEADLLLLNDGRGRFTDASSSRLPPGSPTRTYALALGDVDGDGDLDLAAGNIGIQGKPEQNRLFLNSGQGYFGDVTLAALPAHTGLTYALALGDVDGDGDLDLVEGNAGQNRLLINDGRGRFSDETGTRLPADADWTCALALGDVDRDGDLDLVLGNTIKASNTGVQNRLLLNDGTGRFTDATAGLLPARADFTVALALGDVDGDGDPDLVVGGESVGFPATSNYLIRLLNDGQGRFQWSPFGGLLPVDSPVSSLALRDLDGDGDLDLGVGRTTAPGLLLRNDGSGRFAPAGVLSELPLRTAALAAGDLDGDGDADLFQANCGISELTAEPDRILFNDGRGGFSDSLLEPLPALIEDSSALAAGDVDGDGDADLIVGNGANNNSGPVRLLLNDGRGWFRLAQGVDLGTGYTAALALGDVDGDKDLDLVVGNTGGNSGQQNRLYFNDGKGGFGLAPAGALPPLLNSTDSLALADFDGDGDLDLFVGNRGVGTKRNELYLNQGNGWFVDASANIPAETAETNALAVGDVDGDGDLDLILGQDTTRSGQNRFLLNDGRAGFTYRYPQPMRQDDTFAVALGDVDGDGDLDFIAGNSGPNYLYLNDGMGNFADATAGRLPGAAQDTRALALGDVDRDGDLDLLAGNFGGQPNQLFLNDGNGYFSELTNWGLPAGGDWTSSVLLVDLDGDGDLDAVEGNGGGYAGRPNRLLLNIRRQIHLPDQPWIGAPLRIEGFARPPGAPEARLFLGLVGTAAGDFPIPPFGRFGLGGCVLPLAVLTTDPVTARASYLLPLPPDPALAGAPLWFQGLAAEASPPGWNWQLTNVAADRCRWR